MKAYLLSVFLLVAAIAGLASYLNKPTDPPLAIDAQSPGAWANYAAADRLDMIEQYVCIRQFRVAPPDAPKGEVRT